MSRDRGLGAAPTAPRRELSDPWRGRGAWLVDVGLAAAVFVFEFGVVLSDAPPWNVEDFGPVDGLRLAAFSLPILLRRRFPVAVLASMVIAFVGSDLLGPGLVVGFYAVGAFEDDRRVSIAAAVAGSMVATGSLVAFRGVVFPLEALVPLAAFGGAWYLGDLSRIRRRYAEVLEERACRAEEEHDADCARAAADERTRIARELHDVVAHRVSMMTVQAGAAGVVASTDPEAARRAIGAVEDAGRQALVELRRLVGVLRTEEDDPLAPRPGIDRLEDLVADVERAGVPVRLRLMGDRPDVPETLELSIYRIVQEALTNVMKHAGPGAEADVVVSFAPDGVTIEVTDTGPPVTGAETGHGIIGMGERASAFGGTLAAGPRPEGGFGVRAEIPWRR